MPPREERRCGRPEVDALPHNLDQEGEVEPALSPPDLGVPRRTPPSGENEAQGEGRHQQPRQEGQRENERCSVG
ncbi:hypothetical protein E2C01_098182 [Portunus trituberculatus]|uniref:Uncharacterized protein n=1 Tax=Portunus trituberculatus TaxID=210409 RepID=A0A5B7KC92_PORTR|nr:hypothetical protein [Portunus trituberculatus]